jgi:hypothetical protein
VHRFPTATTIPQLHPPAKLLWAGFPRPKRLPKQPYTTIPLGPALHRFSVKRPRCSNNTLLKGRDPLVVLTPLGQKYRHTHQTQPLLTLRLESVSSCVIIFIDGQHGVPLDQTSTALYSNDKLIRGCDNSSFFLPTHAGTVSSIPPSCHVGGCCRRQPRGFEPTLDPGDGGTPAFARCSPHSQHLPPAICTCARLEPFTPITEQQTFIQPTFIEKMTTVLSSSCYSSCYSDNSFPPLRYTN